MVTMVQAVELKVLSNFALGEGAAWEEQGRGEGGNPLTTGRLVFQPVMHILHMYIMM